MFNDVDDAFDNDAGVDVTQDVTKFTNTVNIALLYHQFYSRLSELFSMSSSPMRGIEYFYNAFQPFLILEDREFREEYDKIREKFGDNTTEMYQLHHAELAKLLARAGVMPRPDVIQKVYSHDAPKSIDELQQNGSEADDSEDYEDYYEEEWDDDEENQ